MREFKTNDWGRIVHRVDASACRAITLRRGCGGFFNTSLSSHCGYKKQFVSTRLKVRDISRDEMHAHIFASPSSAVALRKHLTELNAFRISNAEEADI